MGLFNLFRKKDTLQLEDEQAERLQKIRERRAFDEAEAETRINLQTQLAEKKVKTEFGLIKPEQVKQQTIKPKPNFIERIGRQVDMFGRATRTSVGRTIPKNIGKQTQQAISTPEDFGPQITLFKRSGMGSGVKVIDFGRK